MAAIAVEALTSGAVLWVAFDVPVDDHGPGRAGIDGYSFPTERSDRRHQISTTAPGPILEVRQAWRPVQGGEVVEVLAAILRDLATLAASGGLRTETVVATGTQSGFYATGRRCHAYGPRATRVVRGLRADARFRAGMAAEDRGEAVAGGERAPVVYLPRLTSSVAVDEVAARASMLEGATVRRSFCRDGRERVSVDFHHSAAGRLVPLLKSLVGEVPFPLVDAVKARARADADAEAQAQADADAEIERRETAWMTRPLPADDDAGGGHPLPYRYLEDFDDPG